MVILAHGRGSDNEFNVVFFLEWDWSNKHQHIIVDLPHRMTFLDRILVSGTKSYAWKSECSQNHSSVVPVRSVTGTNRCQALNVQRNDALKHQHHSALEKRTII